jgi:hypothetical protein
MAQAHPRIAVSAVVHGRLPLDTLAIHPMRADGLQRGFKQITFTDGSSLVHGL